MLRILPAFVVLCSMGGAAAQTSGNQSAPLDFQGKALVILSDADMVASAYVDGRLGLDGGADTLSVIALGGHPRTLEARQVLASNSVAGPPVAVAVTPDGRHAIVVETFRPRLPDRIDATFASLQFGNRIQVVDISDPGRPAVVQTVDGPVRPDAVSISPDGALVAIAVHPSGDGAKSPLVIYPFASGRLGQPSAPAIPGWHPGDRLIHAEFHPTLPVLALLNETRAELSFARLESAASTSTLASWGNVVRIEKSPYMVRFTPDGRHAIANALYWGPDVQGTWTEAPRGSIVSVRVDARRTKDGTPVHALVSRAMTGVSPEGIAISPDGSLVVSTNLERSYLPFDDPRQTWFSSLTLVRLDPHTGTLNRVGDFAFDGILPESAAFDASGRFLAVTSFERYAARGEGSCEFWRVAQDPLDSSRLALVRTGYSVPVTRGAHSMVLVR